MKIIFICKLTNLPNSAVLLHIWTVPGAYFGPQTGCHNQSFPKFPTHSRKLWDSVSDQVMNA